ncbi:hypothetical protein NL108_005410 [Boleophthalmus pectinirostris]|nr:hypothetical protein NL108_005410 [Boleophthalmus pectinirostris]
MICFHCMYIWVSVCRGLCFFIMLNHTPNLRSERDIGCAHLLLIAQGGVKSRSNSEFPAQGWGSAKGFTFSPHWQLSSVAGPSRGVEKAARGACVEGYNAEAGGKELDPMLCPG